MRLLEARVEFPIPRRGFAVQRLAFEETCEGANEGRLVDAIGGSQEASRGKTRWRPGVHGRRAGQGGKRASGLRRLIYSDGAAIGQL
jgi:hypothetical protein